MVKHAWPSLNVNVGVAFNIRGTRNELAMAISISRDIWLWLHMHHTKWRSSPNQCDPRSNFWSSTERSIYNALQPSSRYSHLPWSAADWRLCRKEYTWQLFEDDPMHQPGHEILIREQHIQSNSDGRDVEGNGNNLRYRSIKQDQEDTLPAKLQLTLILRSGLKSSTLQQLHRSRLRHM